MRVYFVRRWNVRYDMSWRTGPCHYSVYHGVATFYGKVGKKFLEWRSPAETNSNRELVHVSRSGRFVPPVFGNISYLLIVSEQVRERLADLPRVEFTPVIFERLVDLPMPALGDFSWYERPVEYDERGNSILRHPNEDISNLPDLPAFHETIGEYFQLLVPNLHDVEEEYADIEQQTPNWGSYLDRRSKPLAVSRELLGEAPIITSSATHIFRDDAFKRIAPFLDLDYYNIARIDL